MMWGMALYQQGIFEHGLDKSTLLKCIAVTCIFSAIDSILSFSVNPVLVEFSTIMMMVSAVAMALIYIHLVVKACQNSEQSFAPFQAAGKLAFSCYILQSLIGVGIFRYAIYSYCGASNFNLNDFFVKLDHLNSTFLSSSKRCCRGHQCTGHIRAEKSEVRLVV